MASRELIAFFMLWMFGGTTPAPGIDVCRKVEDCDGAWAVEAAYKCEEGRCFCHPDAEKIFDHSRRDCKCRQGFWRKGRECLNHCEFEEDCPENQTCNTRENSCICKDNFINITGECKPVAKTVDASCDVHEQCVHHLGGYSECKDGRCACSIESVSNTTSCLQKKSLSERCEQTVQCSSFVEHSFCSSDICACTHGYVMHNASACLPVVNGFREICTIGIQCHQGMLGQGSDCINSKCECEDEYFYDNDLKKCLRKGEYGANCGGDTGCYLNDDGDNQTITCLEEKCQCKKGSVISDNRRRCVPSSANRTWHSISLSGVVLFFLIYSTH